MIQKSITVTILGESNAGKSTLINLIIGKKISIVTYKEQTTRNVITGIQTIHDTQIVFLDTPGIYKARENRDKNMVKQAWISANDSDLILFMVDPNRNLNKVLIRHAISSLESRDIISELTLNNKDTNTEEPQTNYTLIKDSRKIAFLINKTDIADKDNVYDLEKQLRHDYPNKEVFKISSKNGFGTPLLMNYILSQAQPKQWQYPNDAYTNLSPKFIVSEITREQIFLKLKQELPYHMIVQTEKYQINKKNELVIYQTIYVTSHHHKKMLIGKDGEKIKQISMESRRNIAINIGYKVHLYLYVKIKDNILYDPQIFSRI